MVSFYPQLILCYISLALTNGKNIDTEDVTFSRLPLVLIDTWGGG